jgi:prepilin-type N-terminal cleavage/methylation domain-containing protein
MKICKIISHPHRVGSGMTLVELLIAVFIIGMSCMAVFIVHISSLKTKNVSDNMTFATTIAVTEFERLKTLPFETLLGLSNTVDENLDRMGVKCKLSDCQNYIFTRKVRFFSKTPTSLSCHVEIEVDWIDTVGRHSLLFNSIITSMAFT